MTRLLLLNPNTTHAVTDLMMRSALAIAAPGVELRAVTAPRGVPYISNRSEALIGGAIAMETLAEVAPAPDVAILAAFGDPGLFAMREAFDFPVIGVSEAAMLAACMIGGKFLIVSFTSAMLGWYRDCVVAHGLDARCAGVVALDLPFGALDAVQEMQGDALIDFARAEAEARDAACVIFAGAPLAGLAARARARLERPVIDPVAAAVKLAEALAALRPMKATAGSFARPAAKDSFGLSAPLANHLRRSHAG
jgi:Asp/Glu/hydantoin racemase